MANGDVALAELLSLVEARRIAPSAEDVKEVQALLFFAARGLRSPKPPPARPGPVQMYRCQGAQPRGKLCLPLFAFHRPSQRHCRQVARMSSWPFAAFSAEVGLGYVPREVEDVQ